MELEIDPGIMETLLVGCYKIPDCEDSEVDRSGNQNLLKEKVSGSLVLNLNN